VAEVGVVQLRVLAAGGQQRLVVAFFDDLAVAQHDDAVQVAQGVQRPQARLQGPAAQQEEGAGSSILRGGSAVLVDGQMGDAPRGLNLGGAQILG
jgi:hypothetical protein